ncbi:hypothetical protein [Streptomyces sp. 061-3]|uniref:hypothetical protein n=1 Tax=Streptomyces sp. 061-3 TaxID=2789268 RepID=UPI00397EA34E
MVLVEACTPVAIGLALARPHRVGPPIPEQDRLIFVTHGAKIRLTTVCDQGLSNSQDRARKAIDAAVGTDADDEGFGAASTAA